MRVGIGMDTGISGTAPSYVTETPGITEKVTQFQNLPAKDQQATLVSMMFNGEPIDDNLLRSMILSITDLNSALAYLPATTYQRIVNVFKPQEWDPIFSRLSDSLRQDITQKLGAVAFQSISGPSIQQDTQFSPGSNAIETPVT